MESIGIVSRKQLIVPCDYGNHREKFCHFSENAAVKKHQIQSGFLAKEFMESSLKQVKPIVESVGKNCRAALSAN